MLRADLILVFKILHTIDPVDKDRIFFTFAIGNRSGHSLKKVKS